MGEDVFMIESPSYQTLLFYTFSSIAVATAINVVLQKNPVISAISLVFTFFSLAGIYGLMGALFIATMQVLVYAGAIMVLVVFVLMLLSQRAESLSRYRQHPFRLLSLLLFAVLFFFLLYAAWHTGTPKVQDTQKGYQGNLYEYSIQGQSVVAAKGNVASVGASTYLDYLLPFEMISILLLVAVLGAVILAKKRISDSETLKDSTL